MTNETKLWQRRAGLITEDEYQESMDEMDTGEEKPVTSASALATDFIKTAADVRKAGSDITGLEPQMVDTIVDKLLKISKESNQASTILKAIDKFIDTRLQSAAATPTNIDRA